MNASVVDQEESRSLNHDDDRLIEFALNVLGPRWTSAVLVELFCGKKRTMELLRALPKLSAKTLSERLKRLMELGLISRTVYAEVPPRVEYALTEEGDKVFDALLVLKSFGERCVAAETQDSGNGNE